MVKSEFTTWIGNATDRILPAAFFKWFKILAHKDTQRICGDVQLSCYQGDFPAKNGIGGYDACTFHTVLPGKSIGQIRVLNDQAEIHQCFPLDNDGLAAVVGV